MRQHHPWHTRRPILLAIAVAVLMPVFVPPPAAAAGSDVLSRVGHIVVIYEENWSFDSLYGKFPGAKGLANAGDAVKQVDANGSPYTVLPQPLDTSVRPPAPDTRFPGNLPVQPFEASQYVQPDQKTGDLVHRFYQEQLQIDGGKMDKFVAYSDAAGLVMSYYDASSMPEGQLARQYVITTSFMLPSAVRSSTTSG